MYKIPNQYLQNIDMQWCFEFGLANKYLNIYKSSQLNPGSKERCMSLCKQRIDKLSSLGIALQSKSLKHTYKCKLLNLRLQEKSMLSNMCYLMQHIDKQCYLESGLFDSLRLGICRYNQLSPTPLEKNTKLMGIRMYNLSY